MANVKTEPTASVMPNDLQVIGCNYIKMHPAMHQQNIQRTLSGVSYSWLQKYYFSCYLITLIHTI